MSSDSFPFTMATVLEQCGGNKMIAGAVLEEFLVQVPADIGEMESSLTSGDLLTASKAAHRLKGTAGVLGAMRLYPLCAELEMAGKSGDVAKTAAIFSEVKVEAQRCADAVPTGMEMLK